jgi:hypothetical protein
LAGFFDFLRNILGGSDNSPENVTEPTQNEPEISREERSGGSFFGRLFGTNLPEASNRAEEVERDLQEFDPQDEAQGLFFVGWLDGNVSTAAREKARELYEQKYGDFDPGKGRRTFGADNWEKWRAWMGYA